MPETETWPSEDERAAQGGADGVEQPPRSPDASPGDRAQAGAATDDPGFGEEVPGDAISGDGTSGDGTSGDGTSGDGISGEAVVQEVEAYPVLAEAVEVERVRLASMPAVQAAALAATGFVAGAATVVLVRRHTARKLARAGLEQAALRELRDAGEPSRRAKGAVRRSKRAAEEPAASATYLVNVRLLARTED